MYLVYIYIYQWQIYIYIYTYIYIYIYIYISMTNDKNLIPLLYLVSNCILTKSAPHMLSLNNEYN